jgi:hypothetical protein
MSSDGVDERAPQGFVSSKPLSVKYIVSEGILLDIEIWFFGLISGRIHLFSVSLKRPLYNNHLPYSPSHSDSPLRK